MADVSLVNSGSPTKPLSQFMMNNRVEPPVSADAPGCPGDWSVDGEKLYLCLAPSDWFALSLVRVSGESVNPEPVQSELDDGADDSGEADGDASDASEGDQQESDAEMPADEAKVEAAE